MTSNTPLAERMRPQSLDEIVGQDHLVGPDGVISGLLHQSVLPSMIFWGPPGVGKTTLAEVLAQELERPFYSLSAISSGVKDIRQVIEKAKKPDLYQSKAPILFIDEIHRFSKSQQDALLGAVEKGWVTLIGATTENPSFEVNRALLSRSNVYVLKPLDIDTQKMLVNKALKKDSILSKKKVVIKEWEALLRYAGSDGRKVLNQLDHIVQYSPDETVEITNDYVTKVLQETSHTYDKGGEEHYDVISAFIKSIRGSDPNGALYWLARMIEGGEDAKFIARRLVISASEDVGMANPTALVIANNCFQAVANVGYPECEIMLSQATVYLAVSPKSNASYKAIKETRAFIRENGELPVPLHLRNSPTELMEELGYGKGYKYAHDYPGNFVDEDFLPDELKGKQFFKPGNSKKETEIRQRLKSLWKDRYNY